MIAALQRPVILDCLALLLGVIYPLAFAPFNASPLIILSISGLFALWYWQPERAVWRSWLFGLGLFGVGTYWVHISIHEFSGVWLWLALLLAGAFASVIALYFTAAAWLARRVISTPIISFLLLFPAIWGLFEWVRGWLFTGFPWLAAGYSQIDSPLSGYAAFLGVYGIGYIVALIAGCCCLLAMNSQRLLASAVILTLFGLGLVGQHFSLSLTEESGDPINVSMIQGNIDQDKKWLSEWLQPTLVMYHQLTEQHWDSDLIIWPETAVPAFYQQVERYYLTPLAERAKQENAVIITGIPVAKGEDYFNSMIAIGSGKTQFYHKSHLVPFGEFMPFKPAFGWLLKILNIPMSNFSRGDAIQPPFQVKGIPVALTICYEDAFGEEMIRALPEAQLLVNVSNDAWFGDSMAPHQHLQMARMRALELGRTMLRNTNTGVTAVVGPDGSIISSIPQFTETVLTASVSPRKGATWYVIWGNYFIVCLMVGMLLLAFGFNQRLSHNT